MKKHQPPLEFTLFENGLDFIWSAVEHLSADSSKQSLKYAVLNLAAGVELILKERLRRKSWTLLFADPAKANERAYRRGAFKSAGPESVIERLKFECGVELSESEQKRLGAIRTKRNRIQHFNMVDSAQAIISATANALEVLIDFIGNELNNPRQTKAEENLLKNIRAKLNQLEQFVTLRERSIKPALKEAYSVFQCPSCLQDALAVDGDAKCLFCGYAADGAEAASDYATDVLGVTWKHLKDGYEWPVGLCPSCGMESCVETGSGGSDAYICFCCGESWALGSVVECVRCGRWIDHKVECSVCDGCFDEYLRRD